MSQAIDPKNKAGDPKNKAGDPNDTVGTLSHASLGTNDYDKALIFYETVLPVLGLKKIVDFPKAAAFGRAYPELWVQTPSNGRPATVGNGYHLGLVAPTKAAVDKFHEVALAAGATNAGDPGGREQYGPAYYGCFIYDLDGHKIEACFWKS